MDELDKRIRKLWIKHKKTGPLADKGECPQDDLLAKYVDGALKEDEKILMEQHFVSCNDCLELVLMSKRAAADEGKDKAAGVPGAWIEKVMGLTDVKRGDPGEGLFDIVLKFIKEKIEVIENMGDLSILSGAEPVLLRDGGESEHTNPIVLGRTFSDMKIRIEIEKLHDKHVHMKVAAHEIATGDPAADVRVSLFNPDQEIESYIAEEGIVCFLNLKLARYMVRITSGAREIGQISLNLT